MDLYTTRTQFYAMCHVAYTHTHTYTCKRILADTLSTTYLPYIPRLPLQTYKTYIPHIYPTPTCLPYPYNPYNTLHPTPYTACWPHPCTHAQRVCG